MVISDWLGGFLFPILNFSCLHIPVFVSFHLFFSPTFHLVSNFLTDRHLCGLDRDPDLEPAGATDDEDKKSDKSRSMAPRRKFDWNKDIR